MQMIREWVQNKAALLIAFSLSVLLGVVGALHRADTVSDPPAARPQSAAIVGAERDPAAESVRALPEYRRACAARANGNAEEASSILERLSTSTELNEMQREFCRRSMRH